jgi:energy-converting hydrogenase Eha subunit A
VVRDPIVFVIAGELLVATIASLTFFALARPRRFSYAVAASFIANAASYGLGVLARTTGLLR